MPNYKIQVSGRIDEALQRIAAANGTTIEATVDERAHTYIRRVLEDAAKAVGVEVQFRGTAMTDEQRCELVARLLNAYADCMAEM